VCENRECVVCEDRECVVCEDRECVVCEDRECVVCVYQGKGALLMGTVALYRVCSTDLRLT